VSSLATQKEHYMAFDIEHEVHDVSANRTVAVSAA
jgi:hypothetical protein